MIKKKILISTALTAIAVIVLCVAMLALGVQPLEKNSYFAQAAEGTIGIGVSTEQELKENLVDGGPVYLLNDIELQETLKLISVGSYSIDLNGNSLNLAAGKTGSVIYLENGTFTLNDTAGGGVISGGNDSGVCVGNASTSAAGMFYMYGGTITNNKSLIGGGVYVARGGFTMQSGAISGNEATGEGGGVYVASGAEFNINERGSCRITGNKARVGGGVYAYGSSTNNATFTMNGGTISNNVLTGQDAFGGGVYVGNCDFDMQSGTISGNEAKCGGGVYVGSGEFTMGNGSVISNNTATSNGGGVYINTNGTLTMNGGEIGGSTEDKKNTADLGGGAYVLGMLNLDGGTISNNEATSCGGGVFMIGKLSMNGGSISNNGANYGGGGAYVSSGEFTMSNGSVISNNTANSNGGGVFINAGGTLTMNGGEIGGSTEAKKNTANNGGGVYIIGTLRMNGGTISNNVAESGGGAYVSSGEFTMSNGSVISNNTANSNGGGVYINTNGTLTMNGGEIGGSTDDKKNTADFGGGVYIIGTLSMNGGTISNNGANYGGGVFMLGALNMQSGTISNNEANYYGGGVYIYTGGKFTMSQEDNVAGCEITLNKAQNDGGGVYVGGSSCQFIMKTGTISGNEAENGGGAYVSGGGEITMKGDVNIERNVASTQGGGVYVDKDSYCTVGSGVNITDNTVKENANNLCLDNITFDITVGLEGTYIGVTLLNSESGIFTLGYESAVLDADPGTYFYADDANTYCKVGLGRKSDTNEAMLIGHEGDYKYDGTEHWIACSVCAKKVNVAKHSFNASERKCETCGCLEQIFWALTEDGKKLTISSVELESDVSTAIKGSFNYNKSFGYGLVPWFQYKATVTGIEVLENVAPTSTANWFNSFSVCESIDLKGLNTSNVSSMIEMFENCKMLTELDLSTFDTAKVTNMYHMFTTCSALEKLTFGNNFDTSNVTTMQQMFSGCKMLTELNLSAFDTRNVDNMFKMFFSCSNLEKLTLGDNFGTASVTDMTNMFGGCEKLTELNLSTFNTAEVTDMVYMFSGCSALGTLTLGNNFTTAKVTDMRYMFYNCSNLTKLNLSSFVINADAKTDSLLGSCGKLKTVNAPKVIPENQSIKLPSIKTDDNNTSSYFYAKTADSFVVAITNEVQGNELIWHTKDAHAATAATCVNVSKCSECNKQLGDKLGQHSFGAWVNEVPATHTANGTKGHKDCTVCNKHFDNNNSEITDLTIAASENAHSYDTAWTSDANSHWHAANCGHDVKSGEAAHTEDGGTVTKAATCTEKGVRTYKCSVCEYVMRTEDIATVDHVYGTWQNEVPATHTANGTKGHKDCTVCNKHFDINNNEITDLVIPAATNAHSFATAWTADETKHWHEANCGHDVKSGEAAHTEDGGTVTKAATCAENGVRTFKCSVCEYVMRTEEIAALEHAYGEWEIIKQATLAENGEKRRVCANDVTHVETAEIPKRVAQLVEPDKDGGEEDEVIVSSSNGLAHDVELYVTVISEESYDSYKAIAESVNGKIGLIYDVTLKSDGVSIQPDGTLTIKLRISDNLKGKEFKLFHLHGSESKAMEYTVEGSYAVVNTDKLSEFIFVSTEGAKEPTEPISPAPAEPEKPDEGGKPNLWWMLPVGIFLIFVAVGITLYIIYRKKQNS